MARFACLIAALFFVTPGWANEYPAIELSAGIGSSVIRDEDGTETFQGNAFAAQVGAALRINQRFAIGVGLFDVGEASDSIANIDTDISVKGFDIHIRLIQPLSATTEVYGLVGVAAYNVDIEPFQFTNPFGEDAWELGGGIDVGIGEQLALRFEARFLNGDRDESAGLLTIGLNYRF